MRLAVCFIISLLATQLQGQFRFVEDGSIPLSIDGNSLERPWEGGINSAQYQKMDLNGDGTEDLVIYHRMSGELTTYLNTMKTSSLTEYKQFQTSKGRDSLSTIKDFVK